MSGFTIDVQRALALELGMAFHVECSLLLASRAIGQRVGGFVLDTNLYTLAIEDVEGCTAGVGQGESTQLHGGLVGAFEGQRSVGGGAAEAVGDFTTGIVADIVALDKGDVGAVDGRSDVLGYVSVLSTTSASSMYMRVMSSMA